MSKTPWELMLTGHREEALRLMRDSYALQSPGAWKAIQLGVAYLWFGDYPAAWEHLNAANQRRPKDYDCLYQMAGAAKWCMGNRREAVAQWVDGCHCDGTSSACFGSPLLLFAASVFASETFARTEADKLLTVRVNDSGTSNWPGFGRLQSISWAGSTKRVFGGNAWAYAPLTS